MFHPCEEQIWAVTFDGILMAINKYLAARVLTQYGITYTKSELT